MGPLSAMVVLNFKDSSALSRSIFLENEAGLYKIIGDSH